MIWPRSKKASTYMKYLLSYFLVFTVLMAGFFLILRDRVSETYHSQRTERLQEQIEAVRANLRAELLFLNQIDALITENPDIKLATYQAEGKYYRITNTQLLQYAQSSRLIGSIIYYSKFSDHVFSTDSYATYDGTVFHLIDVERKQITFDPAPYLDTSAGQLIWLNEDELRYLLYFPKNNTESNYLYFYVLDTQLFHSQLMTLVSDEVPAVALLDSRGNPVVGKGFEAYTDRLMEVTPGSGLHPLTDDTSLLISQEIQNGFSLATVVSERYWDEQVNRAFMPAYLSLLGLSLLGILLVYISMLLTYRPLHKLVKSLGTGSDRN